MTTPPQAIPPRGGPMPLAMYREARCVHRGAPREVEMPASIMTVQFMYRPQDPYAMHLYIFDPVTCKDPNQGVHWVGSREAFLSAVYYGIPLPSMDMEVSVVNARTSGALTLRVTLHATWPPDGDMPGGQTGQVTYLDFDLSPTIRGYFDQIVRMVPPGTEHRHLDLDGIITRILQLEG